MSDEKKELKSTTIGLMVVTAFFFDSLQWLLAFIFMDWLVGLFAFMTLYIWFRTQGIKFSSVKRVGTMAGAFIIEFIPFISMLPAWTAAVTIMVLDQKAKKLVASASSAVPGASVAQRAGVVPTSPGGQNVGNQPTPRPAVQSSGGKPAFPKSNVVPFPGNVKTSAANQASQTKGNVDSLSRAA